MSGIHHKRWLDFEQSRRGRSLTANHLGLENETDALRLVLPDEGALVVKVLVDDTNDAAGEHRRFSTMSNLLCKRT